MPSTPYDLVQDDNDLRAPVHAEQAFFQGITFQAKFIGWEEVQRPNTRTEIVQAMRRIRYECKVQNLKKRKVTIHISVNGVRVLLKKRRRKKKQWNAENEEIELMNHPIYRIFYVSHDSSDLKIFSYIARDAQTNTFKCSVFKSNKKSQAMRIVRTVGQAFEVCHKFNLQKNSLETNDERSDLSSELIDADRISEQLSEDEIIRKEQGPGKSEANVPQRPNHLDLMSGTDSSPRKSSPCGNDTDKSPPSPLPTSQEIQKLKEQLEQQTMQTRQALAQLMLVREQLVSETNARIEAQARTQQLLQQNRELLEHLASMGGYSEQNPPGLTSANIALAPQTQASTLAAIQQAFLSPTTSNNLATINQQINNLGFQLSGLNQQKQNLQNFENLNAQQQQQQQSPQAQQQIGSNALTPTQTQFPTLGQIQNISNKLNDISSQANQQQQQQQSLLGTNLQQKDLFQMNHDLLNRLQLLNLDNNTAAAAFAAAATIQQQNFNNNNNSPHNSYLFANPLATTATTPQNNNQGSFNFLNCPSLNSLGGNLTPSPIGTISRNSYSNSPLDNNDIGLSLDKNLNILDDTHFIKPLSQVGTLTTLDSDGKVKVIVPISNGGGINTNATGSNESCSRSDSSSSPNIRRSLGSISGGGSSSGGGSIGINICGSSNDQRLSMPNSNNNSTVMLKVTDEAGNIMNPKQRLSATPSFIQRSTSEKVPNRSQMMSQVQRAGWQRHTTK